MLVGYINAALSVTFVLLQALRIFTEFEIWFIVLPIAVIQVTTTVLECRKSKTAFRLSILFIVYVCAEILQKAMIRERIRVFLRVLSFALCLRYCYDLFRLNRYQDDVFKLLLMRDETKPLPARR